MAILIAFVITAFCNHLSAMAFSLPLSRQSNTLIHPAITSVTSAEPRASTTLFNSNNSNNDVNLLQQINNALDTTYATLIDLLFYGKLPSPLPSGMRRVPTQFIAALGTPTSSSSDAGAEQWGIWRVDPGPRGVYVQDFQRNPSLGKNGNSKMKAGWEFDPNDFWIEEFGRVMEKPDFPVSPGRYMVTGGRKVTTLLTVDPPDGRGRQAWRLEEGTLYDVTHLPCRSARYFPKPGQEGKRSPADANWNDFPVRPGADMPSVKGCDKQDYAVLFVVAVEK